MNHAHICTSYSLHGHLIILVEKIFFGELERGGAPVSLGSGVGEVKMERGRVVERGKEAGGENEPDTLDLKREEEEVVT